MTDLIRRADAIEAVDRIKSTDNWQGAIIALLSALPSADAVSREEVTAIKNNYINEISELLNKIDALSADAEQITGKLKNPCDSLLKSDSDECKEHQSKLESADAVDVAHDIPEYCSWSQTYTNMVQGAMSKASAEAVQGWIPIKYHEITEIERKENGYPKDWVYFLDCEMPQDGQEILVQAKNGEIRWDVCYEDDGFSLDSGWDWKDDIIAWMPLPDPYKGGDDE